MKIKSSGFCILYLYTAYKTAMIFTTWTVNGHTLRFSCSMCGVPMKCYRNSIKKNQRSVAQTQHSCFDRWNWFPHQPWMSHYGSVFKRTDPSARPKRTGRNNQSKPRQDTLKPRWSLWHIGLRTCRKSWAMEAFNMKAWLSTKRIPCTRPYLESIYIYMWYTDILSNFQQVLK